MGVWGKLFSSLSLMMENQMLFFQTFYFKCKSYFSE